MKDFIGNELNVGDNVVYIFRGTTSSYFIKSKIERFTKKCVYMIDGSRKAPDKVIKINL